MFFFLVYVYVFVIVILEWLGIEGVIVDIIMIEVVKLVCIYLGIFFIVGMLICFVLVKLKGR